MGKKHVVENFSQAMKSQNWDLAFALAVEGWTDLLNPERLDIVTDAIASVPTEVVGDNSMLALAVGGLLMSWGWPARSEDFLALPCVTSTPEARASAALLRAHLTWWLTSSQEALQRVELARDELSQVQLSELIAVPGFETITTSAEMLEISHGRALLLHGKVAEGRAALSMLTSMPPEVPAVHSVSAWATKAWADALVGANSDATIAARTSFRLAGEGGWLLTPSIVPAHLALALIAARSSGHSEGTDHLAEASELAGRADAALLIGATESTALLCGDTRRFVGMHSPARFGTSTLTYHINSAWYGRIANRGSNRREARRLVALSPPHELTLGPWVEVALDTYGRDVTTEIVGHLDPPSTPVGHILRQGAMAATAIDVESRDHHARHALELAHHHGLLGLLKDLPQSVLKTLVSIAPDDPWVALNSDRGTLEISDTGLTEREMEILALLHSPLTINSIATEVFLSTNTAKWYVRRIYRKLGAHSRVEAISRAEELGRL